MLAGVIHAGVFRSAANMGEARQQFEAFNILQERLLGLERDADELWQATEGGLADARPDFRFLKLTAKSLAARVRTLQGGDSEHLGPDLERSFGEQRRVFTILLLLSGLTLVAGVALGFWVGRSVRRALLAEIAERERAEAQARDTEVRYRRAVEQIPAIVHAGLPGTDATALYVSPQIEPILGISPAEYVADPGAWLEHLHPDDRDSVIGDYTRYIEGGEGDGIFEYRLVRDGEKVVWVEDRVTVVRNQSGRPTEVHGVMLDITDIKEAEELRRQTEKELRRDLEILERSEGKRRRILEDLVTAHERERDRLAEAIEDGSIQQITAVGIRLEALRRSLSEPEQLGAVDELNRAADQAMARLRNLLAELRPRTLGRDGLASALSEYAETIAAESGAEFAIEDRLEEEPPSEVRTPAFRVAQGAVAGLLESDPGGRVSVELESHRRGILVRISDEGRSSSRGEIRRPDLAAMRRRVELAGGWIRATGGPEESVVEFWLPEDPAVPARASVPRMGESLRP